MEKRRSVCLFFALNFFNLYYIPPYAIAYEALYTLIHLSMVLFLHFYVVFLPQLFHTHFHLTCSSLQPCATGSQRCGVLLIAPLMTSNASSTTTSGRTLNRITVSGCW